MRANQCKEKAPWSKKADKFPHLFVGVTEEHLEVHECTLLYPENSPEKCNMQLHFAAHYTRMLYFSKSPSFQPPQHLLEVTLEVSEEGYSSKSQQLHKMLVKA